jgi:hypothetical protein
MPRRRMAWAAGAVLVVAPHVKPCGAFCFHGELREEPASGPSRLGTEVTLEVTSALNLVSTTVSGYLKFAL